MKIQTCKKNSGTAIELETDEVHAKFGFGAGTVCKTPRGGRAIAVGIGPDKHLYFALEQDEYLVSFLHGVKDKDSFLKANLATTEDKFLLINLLAILPKPDQQSQKIEEDESEEEEEEEEEENVKTDEAQKIAEEKKKVNDKLHAGHPLRNLPEETQKKIIQAHIAKWSKKYFLDDEPKETLDSPELDPIQNFILNSYANFFNYRQDNADWNEREEEKIKIIESIGGFFLKW